MNLSFSEFLGEIANSPAILTITILLIIMFILNGFTDSPNTIVTTVSNRSLNVDLAIIVSSIMNFFGVLSVGIFIPKVAITISNLVDFAGNNTFVFISIFSVFLSIVSWIYISWKLGYPTSESHCIIGALIGSFIGLTKSFDGINFKALIMILIGFIAVMILSFILGYIIVSIIKIIFKNHDRTKVKKPFNISNILSSMALSFMHGAHNGQKLVGLFLVVFITLNEGYKIDGAYPIWITLILAIAMGVGTSIGGKKIIKSVGMHLVNLENYEGFSTDLSSFIVLLIATLIGLPISTTHSVTCSVMGVGASKRLSSINWKFGMRMALVWILTLPATVFLGYIFSKFIFLFVR